MKLRFASRRRPFRASVPPGLSTLEFGVWLGSVESGPVNEIPRCPDQAVLMTGAATWPGLAALFFRSTQPVSSAIATDLEDDFDRARARGEGCARTRVTQTHLGILDDQ